MTIERKSATRRFNVVCGDIAKTLIEYPEYAVFADSSSEYVQRKRATPYFETTDGIEAKPDRHKPDAYEILIDGRLLVFEESH